MRALNQHLFKVTLKLIPSGFTMVDRCSFALFQNIAASKATTMGHIQRKHLSEARVNCPPDSAECCRLHFAPLMHKQLQNSRKSYAHQLRDTLLPNSCQAKSALKTRNARLSSHLMSGKFTEDHVEQVCLDWLVELGYDILHGPDISPDVTKKNATHTTPLFLKVAFVSI